MPRSFIGLKSGAVCLLSKTVYFSGRAILSSVLNRCHTKLLGVILSEYFGTLTSLHYASYKLSPQHLFHTWSLISQRCNLLASELSELFVVVLEACIADKLNTIWALFFFFSFHHQIMCFQCLSGLSVFAEAQPMIFILDAFHGGYCFTVSFTLSEQSKQLWFLLITAV